MHEIRGTIFCDRNHLAHLIVLQLYEKCKNYCVNVQFLLSCILNLRAISRYEPLGACIWRVDLKEAFLRLRVCWGGGGGRGLYLEGLILRNFTVLLYRLILCLYPSVKPTVTFKRCPTPVTEGDNATLYCNVSGCPVPNVAWVNASSGNIESPTKTLVITAITRSERGSYICHASNEIGNGTQTCEIDVYCKLFLLLNRRFY